MQISPKELTWGPVMSMCKRTPYAIHTHVSLSCHSGSLVNFIQYEVALTSKIKPSTLFSYDYLCAKPFYQLENGIQFILPTLFLSRANVRH